MPKRTLTFEGKRYRLLYDRSYSKAEAISLAERYRKLGALARVVCTGRGICYVYTRGRT